MKTNNSMKNSIHIASPPIPHGRARQRAGWCRLVSLLSGSILALAMQIACQAQSPFELINVYAPFGQTMSGKAAVGLPGDIWNAGFGVSPFVDAQGNSTSLAYASAWGWGPAGYSQQVDESPETVNLLTGYYFGGSPVQEIFSGLIPNTNYTVITYLSGNTDSSGGTNTWVDGAGVTNIAAAINHPLTTKANFTEGQNYTRQVGMSASDGTISNTIVGFVGVPTLNGVQIQLTPNSPVMYHGPSDQKVFTGRSATFTSASAGLPPLTFGWQFNGSPLNDGGATSGTKTPILAYGNVSSSGTVASFSTNNNGTASSNTTLTVVTPATGSYAAAVNSNNPVAYWLLNETNALGQVYEYIKGSKGTVGSSVTIGAGVPNPPFVGFPVSYQGAQFVVNDPNSKITVPALNLNANNVTITAWVHPNGPQVAGAPILLTRSGTGGAGLQYGSTTDQLGYNWNGNFAGYNSGLTVPENMWSFVALVIQPSQATLYVFNQNGLSGSVNVSANATEAWAGTAEIGADPADTAGTNNFNGAINDVSVFNQALTAGQVFAMYNQSLGQTPTAPNILVQPQSKTVSQGAISVFNVVAIGSAPLTYQWKLNGSPLSNNGHYAGTTTSTLTVNNTGAADVGNYTVVVTGGVAPPATSSQASLALANRPLLINVDIITGGNPGYVGAGVTGLAGDIWTKVTAGTASLVDYAGNPTALTIANTGGARADNLGGASPVTNSPYQNLMRSYRYGNAAVFTMTVAGADTNAAYTFITYNAGDTPGQGATLGGALSGTTTGTERVPLVLGTNYLINSNIVATDSGRIAFTVTTNGLTDSGGNTVFAALNGLQIVLQNISNSAPILAGQLPANVTNYSGFSQTLSVDRAVSVLPLTYRWYKGASLVSNGGSVSGATTASLTLNPLQLGDSGTYTCIASNANGTASSVGILTVLDSTNAIHWSAPVSVACPESTLEIPGQLVYAESTGGQSNGVDWVVTAGNVTYDFAYLINVTVTGGLQQYNGGNVQVCTNGQPAWDSMLGMFNADTAGGQNGQKTITLGNLTAGMRYTAQLFAQDDRGGTIGQRTAYFADPVVQTDASATIRMQDDKYIVGTFVPANTSQDIIEFLPGNGSGGDVGAGNINAVVVRLAPPQVSLINNHNGTVTATWDQTLAGGGPAHLYSAPSLTGPWTDQGTSGSVTVSASGQQFFRAVLP